MPYAIISAGLILDLVRMIRRNHLSPGLNLSLRLIAILVEIAGLALFFIP